ncbi:phosphatidylserine decarboxylase family protein [Psychroflexus sp. CAK57W]|uniref:phosphatidylserine decarboxylase family protein n=1 Tax=Psychroflexus curvus TaxID=2873595 RepID=UPI001CC9E7BE|nr:phosphatidylserine decarboxylase family protein [Psychroflexus curvus]MBZ9627682.1 phosphatidylserine decarboxylase family protein [Psychroflexus curvus]MBZ9786169.1 phosphatidylserine decarboxylase family protein [Psychroflexus curvus]
MFHKEGYKILVSSLIGLIVINLLTNFLIDKNQQWIITLVFVVTIIMFYLVAQFFRNPKREIDKNENHILAPVDGKVVAIEKVFEPEFVNEERLQVSIFMSPLNVHVTRHPVGGKILYSKYHPGKFLVAWHPKSSEENERTTVVVKTKKFGNLLYRQIAGAVARRIVNYAKEGETAVQGSDSGFIKFGSRVDIFLPLDAEVLVEINEKVKGGKSIISKVE